MSNRRFKGESELGLDWCAFRRRNIWPLRFAKGAFQPSLCLLAWASRLFETTSRPRLQDAFQEACTEDFLYEVELLTHLMSQEHTNANQSSTLAYSFFEPSRTI